jgi:hypothetical protein
MGCYDTWSRIARGWLERQFILSIRPDIGQPLNHRLAKSTRWRVSLESRALKPILAEMKKMQYQLAKNSRRNETAPILINLGVQRRRPAQREFA